MVYFVLTSAVSDDSLLDNGIVPSCVFGLVEYWMWFHRGIYLSLFKTLGFNNSHHITPTNKSQPSTHPKKKPHNKCEVSLSSIFCQYERLSLPISPHPHHNDIISHSAAFVNRSGQPGINTIYTRTSTTWYHQLQSLKVSQWALASQ